MSVWYRRYRSRVDSSSSRACFYNRTENGRGCFAMSVVSPKKSPGERRMSFTGRPDSPERTAASSPDCTTYIELPWSPSLKTIEPFGKVRSIVIATRPRICDGPRPPKKGVCSRKRVRSETSRMRGILLDRAPFARSSLYGPRMNELTLGAAAAALDSELRRFDQLAELLSRLKLDSEKNLDRAVRAAQDAAQSHERVSAAVVELVAAVARARERQEGQAKAVAERAREVVARRTELEAIAGRFVELGSEAGAINSLLKDGGGPPDGGGGGGEGGGR